MELKNNKKNDTYSTSAWPSESTSASAWPVEETQVTQPIAEESTPAGYAKYRALFEFAARNSDEISFQPGDIVMVSSSAQESVLNLNRRQIIPGSF